ncbi:hypothetical protein ABFS82_01G038100 [Erythranthe guttata]|uniref:SET domain-containing protein n=1 Tax=Erythranthe guttata TaxID=4155 RepID=A0A022Q693_ERYGU|nr:PREDICTED: fructose-bisphosphate aldolase-lysine N-methyltransferase, chloroplastic [Erythranthe guttata]EYU22030.1 hypothetical protein MIMGU_mgv1a005857mg [Erythranthe guttata]|eukprot:XP_012856019.1 PREDICTED: fructose-bisphosphate aldolase-lysine N-methyltransferase, chloroplastic [Erythranthe guttata]
MLLHSVILTNTWWAPTQRPVLSTLVRCFSTLSDSFASVSSLEASSRIDETCNDLLPWLEHKAGVGISSTLSIGKSSYGKALYAAENIQTGDCLLKVPYSVQLSPNNLPEEITCLLGDEVGNVARVALLILREKEMGKDSEWAPYITRLPRLGELNNTIFWTDKELAMIRPSALYKETLRQKTQIEKDFFAVKLAFSQFPDKFQDFTLQEFAHAYGLVTSRAWESSKGVSLIPFADFFNHDGNSESYVLSDETLKHTEVIADRDFALGEEVRIRYGKFSNATLLLDFGFTVSCNSYDQVHFELNIPQNDRLYKQKLEILDRHFTRSVKDVNVFNSSWNSFTIKEVPGGGRRRRKGVPQSLRAFGRILTCDSEQELNDLVTEAAQNDGRLARFPLKNRDSEIKAHRLLIFEISRLIEEYSNCIKLLVPSCSNLCGESVLRWRLAQELLTGEVRVLESACAWLENYCSSL